MEYKRKINDNITYVYEVTYDKNKLNEILNTLDDYKYTSVGINRVSNKETGKSLIPALEEKRLVNYLYCHNNKKNNYHVYKGSIKKLDDNTYEYTYSFTKYPELYYIINALMKNISEIRNTNFFHIMHYPNYEQIFMNHLLEYINSNQLKPFDEKPINTKEEKKVNELEKVANSNYDHQGLYNIYMKTLSCFNFKHIATINTNEISENNIQDARIFVKKR